MSLVFGKAELVRTNNIEDRGPALIVLNRVGGDDLDTAKSTVWGLQCELAHAYLKILI